MWEISAAAIRHPATILGLSAARPYVRVLAFNRAIVPEGLSSIECLIFVIADEAEIGDAAVLDQI